MGDAEGDGYLPVAGPAAEDYDEDAALRAAIKESQMMAELMRIAARSPGASSSDEDGPRGGGAAAAAAGGGGRRR